MIPKDLIRNYPELNAWNVMSCYRGSIAHAMYIPNTDPFSVDDKDAMAVCVPPALHYVGLDKYGNRGTKEIKVREWDIVVYEARKMFSLLLKSNPNVLMTLWLDRKHYMNLSPAWEKVIERRDVFASKQAYTPFVGYAKGQLHRMTHHVKEGYMGAKRRAIVNRFGYDIKNAAHLIRLLRMGIEFLTEGTMYVERPDAQELLEIKRGKWSLSEVEREAKRLFELAEEAYIHSPLPERVDRNEVNMLCGSLVSTFMVSKGIPI